VFKWTLLIICGVFALLGIISITMGIKEGALTLMLGVIPPLIYYGYMKENSPGDRFAKKILSGRYGVIIVITIILLYVFSRIIMVAIN